MAAEHKALEERSRLARIRANLDIRTPVDNPRFADEVAAACREQVDSLLKGVELHCGEDVLEHLAKHLHVHFEEVYDDIDLARLEEKYLREKREIGFGQIALQFDDPEIDALLFERQQAADEAPDKWVAVLNLRETTSRAYWTRSHELSHRIAEPPQHNLRFYRHRNDRENALERLIDKVAAEIAFYPPVFRPLIDAMSGRPLTWSLVEELRNAYAPSCSLLATAYAALHYWPRPSYLLSAKLGRRKGRPNENPELRIAIQGVSPTTRAAGLYFIPNMRVPPSSPIRHVYESGQALDAYERLGAWTTSDGKSLPDVQVLTSAHQWRDQVLALVSLD